jgi:hypothetical protein
MNLSNIFFPRLRFYKKIKITFSTNKCLSRELGPALNRPANLRMEDAYIDILN